MTFARGDVVRRNNLVTGAPQIGVVMAVDGHFVTTRWRLTDTATLVRVQHEMHAGEHVEPQVLEYEAAKQAIDQIMRAEREANEVTS